MKKTIALAACAVALIASQHASAQGCLPRDALVATLSDNYSESLKGRGLKGDTNLYEIFMAQDGATWTILQTFPDGTSCIVAAGQHWMDGGFAPAKGGIKG